MRFATKLALLISAAFLGAGGVLVYLQGTWGTRSLEGQIIGKLEDRAFHAMERLDWYLHERTTETRALAADPQLISGDAAPRQVAETLARYLHWHPEYRSLSFYTMDRVRVADTAGLEIGERHALETYWVGIAEGRDFVAGIYRSESLNVWLFHIAAVVRGGGGRPRGVVVSRLSLDFLGDIVRGGASGIRGVEAELHVDLVDREGLLLASSYNPEGVLKETSPDWEHLRGRIRAGEASGSLRYTNPREKTGEEILVFIREPGYRDYPGNGWTLALFVPARAVFAPALRTRNAVALAVLVTGSLLLFVTLVAVRVFSRPIADLSRAAQEVGRGNLAARVEVRSQDELGLLAAAFNRMASELQESRRDLNAYSEGLQRQVDERTAELLEANERLRVELSERVKVQETLEAQGRLLRLSADVNAAMTDGKSAEAILERCVGFLVRDLDAALARIWTLGSEEGALELRASAGLSTRIDGAHRRKTFGKLKIGLIASEQRPLLTNAVLGDPNIVDQEWVRREGIVSFAGYPLVVEGKSVGVLALFGRHPLAPHVLSALEVVADKIAFFVARTSAEAALRASEKRYRDLVDSSLDGIYTVNAEGVFTSMNRAGARIFGHGSPAEIVGRPALDYWRDPRDREAFREVLRAQKSVSAYHIRARKRNGEHLELESSSRILEDENGAFLGIEGVLRDVTERVRAETERELLIAQLQEAAANIRTLSGLLPICAGCKKIRDDQGSWCQIETFVSSRTAAEFSHGLCPDCMKVYFPSVKGTGGTGSAS